MSFNSLDFLLLFAATALLYYLFPHKLRNPLLLISSYVFYAAFSLPLTLFLVLCTLITYRCAILIETYRDTKFSKLWAVVSVVLNLGALAFYKYFNFFSGILFGFAKAAGLGSKSFTLKLLVPLGISFVVFSAVSYTVDVYRGKMRPETNLLKFALFVSFFPKVVQGPIEKASDIIPQFDEVHHFDDFHFRRGLLLFLYGLFMKMVVADRAAIIVDSMYSSLSDYSGAAIAFGTALFAVQIYCDFAGYSYTAIGAAEILGFNFRRNFRQPYMSLSVAEFWRRWHMSLNVWLRDYVYIPLGGNRCSPARKNLNSLITFGVSGLWHGADWGYIIWGLLNAVYIIIETKLKALFAKLIPAKPIPAEGEEPVAPPSYLVKIEGFLSRVFRRVLVFCLVSFSWIFFRAQKLSVAMKAISRIFTKFNWRPFVKYVAGRLAKGAGNTLYGLDVVYGIPVLLISILIVVAVDILSDRHELSDNLARSILPVRWFLYLFLMFSIILFGVYGYGYSAGAFIYAGF